MDGLIFEFDDIEQYVRWRMRQKNWAEALEPLQVAGRLGITTEAVYNAISRGAMQYVRIKGPPKQTRLFIPLYAVEAYEARGRVAARRENR